MIVWIIGLSSAGKTTVGRQLYEKVKAERNNVLFLDGDQLRRVWGDDIGHTREDRHENGWQYCRLSELLDKQGLHAICCVLSLFEEHRDWNREHLSSYFEVYLDVPMETLRRRDEKDLYAQAEAGEIENVVGVDIPFEEPVDPDLVLKNGDDAPSPDTLASFERQRLLPEPVLLLEDPSVETAEQRRRAAESVPSGTVLPEDPDLDTHRTDDEQDWCQQE